ncbi:Uncharacterized membrane protein YccC [Desulfonispora thiosulfatigenes DSM 11270]|uniref:Uncharacterized membrane protein YccC n=1 Tax=Desulfonispora thiosulfatigenes DSM 11270 TaxID=656914 RepID=A0A1W1UFH2_DESTI|nr:FUSC family protein [Desulfonispora thiosulfatigenes]SMB79561.1 Uncharacterized membrane protein YccC [Desulfonispora thiosulfatigenes DSM 11270]
MNTKLIKSKTITFVLIIAYIIIFAKIFGEQNTLIGVTVITAALMLLERDFTISPFRYLICLIGFNLFLAIAAFLAGLNIWIGIPINFIALFTIGFLFCYDLNSNMYIPFGLQYLFMLSAPVGSVDLGVRLISLIFGSITIIIMQFYFNKSRLEKTGNKIIAHISELLLEKVQVIKEEKSTLDVDFIIKRNVIELKKLIAHRRKKSFYLTEGGRINLRILVIFEYISERLNNLDGFYNREDKLSILQDFQYSLDKIINNRNKFNKLEAQKNIEIKCQDKKLAEQLELLYNHFSELESLEDPDNIIKSTEVPKIFNVFEVTKRNLKINTVRFSYALKLGICGGFSIFIMDYFKIPEGRWMAYTVFALIQPYYENSKVKSRQRLKGTLIGGVISFIVFSIFQNPVIKTIMILTAGYLDGFSTTYDKKMICVTVSALGAASLTLNIEGQLFYRLLFLGLGLLVAFIGNKMILPYNLEKANNDLMLMGDSVIDYINREFNLSKKGENNYHTIENLYIIASLIENKLMINNSSDYSRFVSKKNKMVDKIYRKSLLLGKVSN